MKKRLRRPLVLIALVAVLTSAARAAAQAPDSAITIASGFSTSEFLSANTPITLRLSRPLAPHEQLVVLIGSTDLTSLFNLRGDVLTFRARGFYLPAGESEVKVFIVSSGAGREVGRFPLHVLTRAGFEKSMVDPSLTLNNKGQLAAGQSGAGAAPDRPTYQDGSATLGLQTMHARERWSIQTQVNALGVTNEKEALRFNERGADAMRLDLADYAIRLTRGELQLAAGQVSLGENRHLVNSFGSRGLTAAIHKGAATFNAGLANGSSVVGWDNITGLNDSRHRVGSLALALELKPKRPGAFHVDGSLLDASLLPNTGYSEGGIVDAEISRGAGFQFAMSNTSQRLRAIGGMTISRFENGSDSQLSNDTAIVSSQAHRKRARYFEANANLFQNAKLIHLPTTLNAAYRHERIDPLYRSVAAYTQSDVERNGLDLNGSLDAVAVQLAHSRSRDNLDDVASILRTSTRTSGGALTIPSATLFRATRRIALYPTVSLSRQQTHQWGKALPENSDFQVSHVPDQLSVTNEASLQWQGTRIGFGYRMNYSHQDNRQPGRETADLEARANTITMGLVARSNMNVQIDASLERQHNLELSQINRTRRIGVGVTWRANSLTTVDAFTGTSKTHDDGASTDSDFTEARFGFARGVKIWRTADGAAPGQLFFRLARQGNGLNPTGDPLLAPPIQHGSTWNLSSGLTLKLF